MNEFLSFDTMITPLIIKIVFWIGVAGCVIGGIVMMIQGSFLTGLLVLVLGPICVRIYCEILIVIFRIHESLVEIKHNTAKTPSALS
jgi:hypothetical protein